MTPLSCPFLNSTPLQFTKYSPLTFKTHFTVIKLSSHNPKPRNFLEFLRGKGKKKNYTQVDYPLSGPPKSRQFRNPDQFFVQSFFLITFCRKKVLYPLPYKFDSLLCGVYLYRRCQKISMRPGDTHIVNIEKRKSKHFFLYLCHYSELQTPSIASTPDTGYSAWINDSTLPIPSRPDKE